jgi:hypothetical protein
MDVKLITNVTMRCLSSKPQHHISIERTPYG